MKDRITPELINELKPNECFVFASNDLGIHGKGAAKQALKWGAKNGQMFGLSGQTFAIPTRRVIRVGQGMKKIETLSLSTIKSWAFEFIKTTGEHPGKIFLVTAIGCGLAGYTPEDIAPMFKSVVDKENIYLPKSFWKIIMP